MRSFLCCAPIGATKTCIPLFVTSDAVSKNFHYSIAATSTGSSSLVPAGASCHPRVMAPGGDMSTFESARG